jgi:hypothetical protein
MNPYKILCVLACLVLLADPAFGQKPGQKTAQKYKYKDDPHVIWIISDYENSEFFRPKNYIGRSAIMYYEADSLRKDSIGLIFSWYWNEVGDRSPITEEEYNRKEMLGVPNISTFTDSSYDNKSQIIGLSRGGFLPGGVDPMLAVKTAQDSITHDPYDERLKLYRDSLRLWQKFLPVPISKYLWRNVRHLDKEGIRCFSYNLGFDSIMPVGVDVFQIGIDTILLDGLYFHVYFKEPGAVRYSLPCMFPNVVDFEKETATVGSGRGQCVYYDLIGYPKVLTPEEFERRKLIGTKELLDARREYYLSRDTIR